MQNSQQQQRHKVCWGQQQQQRRNKRNGMLYEKEGVKGKENPIIEYQKGVSEWVSERVLKGSKANYSLSRQAVHRSV